MKLKFKSYYFVYYFSIGVIGPYLAVFLQEKNFSGAQIGLLLGALPIARLVFMLGWSYLSDVLNTRRRLLLIGSLGVVAAFLGLGTAESFFTTFLWMLLFSAMAAPLGTISNAIVLDYLEELGKEEEFGLFRLWGSAGFAVSSILMGGLFLDQISEYFTWLLAGIFLVLAGLSLLLPERGKPFTYTGFQGVQIFTQNPKFAAFIFASIFIGATLGIYNNYQTLFLQSLEASPWLIGTIVSLQAVVEVPMMMAVPLVLKRLSMRWMILIGAIVLPIRWLLYMFIQQPEWIIPTQLFNGVAAVSFFVVGVSFIDQLVSPKWRATAQGLNSAALMGIGSGLGIYLAGNVLEQFGIRSIWTLNLILGLIGLVLLILAFTLFKRPGN